jgi:TctA family transporter
VVGGAVVALEPQNLIWCFVGVLVGNTVGVLPGMGPLATISILLPLTFGMKPVDTILMLAGVMYGARYPPTQWPETAPAIFFCSGAPVGVGRNMRPLFFQ